jgi:hypothetical protein
MKQCYALRLSLRACVALSFPTLNEILIKDILVEQSTAKITRLLFWLYGLIQVLLTLKYHGKIHVLIYSFWSPFNQRTTQLSI